MYQVLNLWLCYSSDMNALMHLFLKLLIYSLILPIKENKNFWYFTVCANVVESQSWPQKDLISQSPHLLKNLCRWWYGDGATDQHSSHWTQLETLQKWPNPSAEQLWNNHSGFLSCMIFKCLMLMENATFSCCNHVETYRACVKAYGYIGYFNLDSWFVSKLNPN